MKRIFLEMFFSLALISLPLILLADDQTSTSTEFQLQFQYQEQGSQYQEQNQSQHQDQHQDQDQNQHQDQHQDQEQDHRDDDRHHPPHHPPQPPPVPPPPPAPPEPENHPPVFSGPTQASTTLGTLLVFSATATDPDKDELSFSSVLPESASWATSTGIFSWTPVATSTLGTTTAKFFASDGKATTTHEVQIEVFPALATSTPTTTPQNLAPQFINFNPPTHATATEVYSYDVEAQDPENDPLTFSLDEGPSGMNIASTTGLISWTPSLEQASSTPYGVTISVSDGTNTASTSYQILVASSTATTTPPAPAPSPPSPPPSSGGGSGGGSGDSTPTSGSGGGGGGGGPPFPIRAHNLPEPRELGPSPTLGGGGAPASAPTSDAAPLKPEGGQRTPTKKDDILGGIEVPPPAPQAEERRFRLPAALSFVGLLHPYIWILLISLALLLAYLYYRYRKKGYEEFKESPTLIEENPPSEAEEEWKKLMAQEKE